MTPEQIAAQNFSAKQIAQGFVVEALHPYTDLNGNILYWRIRLKHPNGEKWIRPMFQDQTGAFHLGEPQLTLKPLYGLHYLTKYPDAHVFIVEGEYPADVLNNLLKTQNLLQNYFAVTSGSATSAEKADWQPLKNKKCIIWPDNDSPGLNYAKTVIEKLESISCTISAINPSKLNLSSGGDCVDWLQHNPSAVIQDILKYAEKPTSDENELINQLAKLSPLEYDRTRIITAKTIGIRPATLDNMIKAVKAVRQEEISIPFEEVEPWNEPINPFDLLNEIAATIQRFIVCQKETVVAATLWTAMTWFIDAIQVAPLAIITAPEKRCGKSQMLFLLNRLVNRPLAASNITPAALFRSIDAWQPTLLIDEVDTFMRENEELRGLINCGHTRESAYIIRVTGEEHTPKKFNVWGAKALAGIGKLPDTIMDRSITLELRRKLPEEKAERLRHAEPFLFKKLSAKLARFAQDYFIQVQQARPVLPEMLNDREQDNWESLFAIAEIAGDSWMQLAHTAAIKLSGEDETSQSASIQLLADIQEIYEPQRMDRFSSSQLIEDLCKDDEKPWATYNRGKPITPRQIAARLREFEIVSNTIRIGTTTAKGYYYMQFADAFARYLNNLSVTPSQPAILSDFVVT